MKGVYNFNIRDYDIIIYDNTFYYLFDETDLKKKRKKEFSLNKNFIPGEEIK